jgi:mono/diheme cytochrome c family protein
MTARSVIEGSLVNGRAARGLASLVLMSGLVALAACGGESKPADSAAELAPTPEAAAEVASPAEGGAATVASAQGEALYGRCVACHMANGQGMAGAFPPLDGSEWVSGSPARAIRIVLHGLQGPISVKGANYNAAMIAYGTGVPMSDDEVAAVLTYVRNSWSNSAGPVTAAEVAAVRAETASRTTPWTAAELDAVK